MLFFTSLKNYYEKCQTNTKAEKTLSLTHSTYPAFINNQLKATLILSVTSLPQHYVTTNSRNISYIHHICLVELSPFIIKRGERGLLMIGGDKERKAIILQKLRWMKSLMLSNVYVLKL